MEWDVDFDPEFAKEAKELPRAVQIEIVALSNLLRQFGPQLRRPHVDTLKGSRHTNMKELRFGLADGARRFAFAFDPTRKAILLVGDSKSGVNERQFHRNLIRIADTRFGHHLSRLRQGEAG
ncbi:MAG TPA: type II toxin-antitoxin system RelE/ParE family toxin [Devosiaceae bacterium]|jgi:hypothetical protein|nr:type II toxin-antitoxin system RelE/ParE family toxin [Devosiaceae bacterium]